MEIDRKKPTGSNADDAAPSNEHRKMRPFKHDNSYFESDMS